MAFVMYVLFLAPVPPDDLYQVADPVTGTKVGGSEPARYYAPMGPRSELRGPLSTRPTVPEVIYDEPNAGEEAVGVEELNRLVLGLRGRESEDPSAEERVGHGSGYGELEQVGGIGPDQVVRHDVEGALELEVPRRPEIRTGVGRSVSGSSDGSLTLDPANIPDLGADTSGRRGNFNKKPIFLIILNGII